jgi:hypothetical protein
MEREMEVNQFRPKLRTISLDDGSSRVFHVQFSLRPVPDLARYRTESQGVLDSRIKIQAGARVIQGSSRAN